MENYDEMFRRLQKRTHSIYLRTDWGDYLLKEPKPMKTITTMMKKLLDADTQTLIKADFINGDLDITEEGRTELINILFSDKKADLVAIATQKIADDAASCKS